MNSTAAATAIATSGARDRHADHPQVIALAAGLSASFIHGDFVRGRAAEILPDLDPYDGRVLARVEMAGEDLVEEAVASARSALAGPWAAMGFEKRAALLRSLADAIERHGDELACLEMLDVGKPISHALHDDVPTSVGVLRWFASLADTAYDHSAQRRAGVMARIVREPLGVVAVVLPWNYPLTTLALKLAPALAAGNTVVAKPAENTPLTTLRVAQLAIEAGFPPGVLNVVPGRGDVAGKALGHSAGVAAVNFTGSTRVGACFLRYAADSNLKEVSLECGGKNPAIILPDVTDPARFADAIGAGFMMNSGQLCSSISRLLVPSHLREATIAMLTAQMAAWPMGDPLDPATRIGPLVSSQHCKKVTDAIKRETARGTRMITSNAPVHGYSPRLVKPTVFMDVDVGSDLWAEEIFGPVLAVRFYDDLEDALAIANDTPYGLSAYVFSTDPAAIDKAAGRLDAGFVAINAFCEGDFSTPFGGFKSSGFGGKDKGIHALDQYSRVKSVWWEAA